MRGPEAWSDVPAAVALVIYLYLELAPRGMTAVAFERRLRWMTVCRHISRMALLGVGALVLFAMVAFAKIHWPYPIRGWVPEIESSLMFAFLVGGIVARLTAPRLERGGRVITLQRDGVRTLSVHMRPAGIRKTCNQTYEARPNHIYLVATLLTDYRDTLRALGWHEVEVLSPDVSGEMVARQKFVSYLSKQLPGWRVAFVGARRMRWLRRMAYLTAQRKKASDGQERGVILSLT